MECAELRGGDGCPREGLFYTCFVLLPFDKYHYGLLVHPLWHVVLFTEEQARSSCSQAAI